MAFLSDTLLEVWLLLFGATSVFCRVLVVGLVRVISCRVNESYTALHWFCFAPEKGGDVMVYPRSNNGSCEINDFSRPLVEKKVVD